jgi:hypothetical protein
MADISKLSRLIGGVQRQVDLSSNALVVGSLKVGSVSPTELTKTILDRLVSLQSGADVDATYHTHDGRYFTETELGATTGSGLIGDAGGYSNFTPTGATVRGALQGIDSALAAAAGTSFSDAAFQIYDDGDATKILKFQVAAISGSATRTITMPDSDVNLGQVLTSIQQDGSRAFTANQSMAGFKLTNLAAAAVAGDAVRYEQAILTSGANAFAADQSFGGFKATNLADPISAQDAVTLAYMNARLNGLTPKAPAVAATLTNITLSAPQTIDGVAVVAGNRVLVKNQTLPAENGIYVVAAGAWARSTDMDQTTPFDEFNGAWITVQQGTQAGQVFVQYGAVTTVGTDPVNFAFYNPIAGLIGGDMITFAGSTFSVDLATTSGLESTNPGNVAGQLRIKLEASNPTLFINGSNELAAKLDAAGAIITGASGLAVAVDNSSIEINTNALRVKDAGITLAKLAADSVDENKIVSTSFSATGAIAGGSGTKIAVQVDDSSIEINTNALRVKSTAFDQNTITGGSGSAAAVQHAPKIQEAKVAGEAFAATTLFAVRYAKAADAGFVAGRMYKAAIDASAADNFYVIGLTRPASLLAAGDPMTVVKHGTINVPTHGFTVGAPLFLSAAGAVTETAPTAVDEAVVRVGMVIDANNIDVQIQVVGVN